MSDLPAVQLADDRIIYRASALGSCLRRTLAARLGYQPRPVPAKLQERFDEGHRLELIILEMLERNYGWTLEQPQAEMELHLGTGPDGRELYVVGHADSLGTPPGGTHWMPVDAKAFAQSTMDNFLANGILAFPHYAWQQSAYCEGFAVNKFCLPLYNKETEQLTVKVYDTHPYSYEDIQNRVYQIEGLVGQSVTDIPCPGDWGCPYSHLHDDKPVDLLPEDLTPLVTNYLTAKKKIDTYEKARKTLATLIQSKLPDNGTSTFSSPSATVSIVNNSKRMDTQKVKELLVSAELDPDDYYTPGEGTHIVVKEKT